MSERSFFDRRTAIPGFTFVLLVLIFNYSPLLTVLERIGLDSTFGALLGFITLFSGSSIGFLVSQLWWRQFQKEGGHYYYNNEPRKEIICLIEKYGLRPAQKKTDYEEIQNVLAVYGYVINHELEKNPEIVKYNTRRGDAFHLISATRIVLLVGLTVGFILRVLFQFFVFQWSISQLFASISDIPQRLAFVFSNFMETIPNSALLELLLLTFLVVSSVFLYFSLGKSRDWIATQCSNMASAIVNKSKLRRGQLQEIFPDDYFVQIEPKPSTE